MTRDVSDSADGAVPDGETKRGPTRRGVLRGAAVGLVAGGTLASLPVGFGQETVQTVLLGARTSGWEGVAPATIGGSQNPALELVAGQRYRVFWQNDDGLPHTFSVEDADGNQLQALEVVEVTPDQYDALAAETGEAVDGMTVADLAANETAPAANETAPAANATAPENETPAMGNETNATGMGNATDDGNVTGGNATGDGNVTGGNATGDGNVTDGTGAPELVTVSPQVSERGAVQAVEFEATEEMTTYRCTVHPTTMVGELLVGGGGM